MSTDKSNPGDLFGLESDASDAGSDSDREERRINAPTSTRHKRRKTSHSSDNDSAESASEDEGAAGEDEEQAEEEGKATKLASDGDDDKNITSRSSLKPLTPTELAASRATTEKTGVVYLSSLPPFMKPTKVRSLLARFGSINRIFLSPEDPKAYARRVRFGGNKKRRFEEGWVEFENKKHARLCAETLNTATVGGKKGGYYHDDIWNMKYLPKFKWHHLQSQIAYENASRTAKLRAEIAHETRVNKSYLKNVDRAKMIEGMVEKQKSKRKQEDREEEGAQEEPKQKVRREFRQNRPVEKEAGKREPSAKVRGLLGKIF